MRLTGVQVWRWHQESGTRKTLLDDVSWEVRAGEHWALLGPNGAGKTTLLALAAAVDFPSRGKIELLGKTMGRTDVARLRQEIGFVDVRDAERFAPMLTVREVVETGATGTIGYFRARLTMLDSERSEALLGTFGLGPLAERRFGACSQGERKRALIARALMGQPRLLLLDEPGGGLDLPGRELLLAALARLTNVDPALAVVITTHHVEELPSSTSHAILLRDGAVLAAGAVAQTLTDATLSSCFGMPITVTRTGLRWSAIAASAPTSIFRHQDSRLRRFVPVASTAALPALDPLDFLAIDALLDDEERAIRDTVRQFVRQQVLPEVGDWFEQGILPREVISELAKLGLFGMHLHGYGLPGASAVAYGLTCLELEAGDSGIRSAVSVQGSLAMFAIWRWGSEEQKENWLPRMHAGEVIGCFGLTEPDAGSDPGTMRTHARRDGSDWILNGTKMWITNGSIADIAVVWARTEDGEIRGFIVEKGTPGFTAPEIHKKLSLRASVTSELVLDDVRVPADSMLPGADSLKGPLSCLNEARFGIVFGAVGAARACFEEALSYSKERIVFDKPISAYQLTQQKLAEMALEINRASLLALHIGRMKDAGTLRSEHVSLGKMGNVRGAIEVCRSARTILGGNGITLEYPVIRHMNNLESVLTYEGTHEVHTLVVGHALTGTPAFR